MGEDEVLVLVGDLGDLREDGVAARVSAPPVFCTRAPSAPEWHSNLVVGGIPAEGVIERPLAAAGQAAVLRIVEEDRPRLRKAKRAVSVARDSR